ncbi:YggS family pyridoxal phosphate-dependent enzyme [Ferruginibacter yonginensis]|uniref:Pyridoxal phosphate homeostasis protein n=1 Tax=Ferruginibacter yonginensis TaxID=1310416 RepID=A0ABV8QNH5_9BACT
MVNEHFYKEIITTLQPSQTTLVAVSKLKPVSDIEQLYALGQRDFGENYVQELVEKQPQLPADIRWHFIGHLQSNKVKYIAPFVTIIQSVDSIKLLTEINKQAIKNNRTIACLLQVHIAEEQTKFGFNAAELQQLQPETFTHIDFAGVMGMATFTDDKQKVEREFQHLKSIFDDFKLHHTLPHFNTISMGMSDDYALAIQCGSNMVRIGSLLFGKRG